MKDFFKIYISIYFYNHVGGLWIDGPNLMQARRFHATGIVTDEATKEELLDADQTTNRSRTVHVGSRNAWGSSVPA